jgi:hypothetical protein
MEKEIRLRLIDVIRKKRHCKKNRMKYYMINSENNVKPGNNMVRK